MTPPIDLFTVWVKKYVPKMARPGKLSSAVQILVVSFWPASPLPPRGANKKTLRVPPPLARPLHRGQNGEVRGEGEALHLFLRFLEASETQKAL